MTDETFWNKLEQEVIPTLKERDYKYAKGLVKVCLEAKTTDLQKFPELGHHRWGTLGCCLRDLYYLGMVDKSMGQFCMTKIGLPPERLKF